MKRWLPLIVLLAAGCAAQPEAPGSTDSSQGGFLNGLVDALLDDSPRNRECESACARAGRYDCERRCAPARLPASPVQPDAQCVYDCVTGGSGESMCRRVCGAP